MVSKILRLRVLQQQQQQIQKHCIAKTIGKKNNNKSMYIAKVSAKDYLQKNKLKHKEVGFVT